MLQINHDKEFYFWNTKYSKQRNFNEAKKFIEAPLSGEKERGRLICGYGMTTKNKSDLVGSRSKPLKYSARVV